MEYNRKAIKQAKSGAWNCVVGTPAVIAGARTYLVQEMVILISWHYFGLREAVPSRSFLREVFMRSRDPNWQHHVTFLTRFKGKPL